MATLDSFLLQHIYDVGDGRTREALARGIPRQFGKLYWKNMYYKHIVASNPLSVINDADTAQTKSRGEFDFAPFLREIKNDMAYAKLLDVCPLLFEKDFPWKGVVVAGGMINLCLDDKLNVADFPSSDIDIFMYGKEGGSIAMLSEFRKWLFAKYHNAIYKSRRCIEDIRLESLDTTRIIQVIATSEESCANVLARFHSSYVRCGFRNGKFVALPDCIETLRTGNVLSNMHLLDAKVIGKAWKRGYSTMGQIAEGDYRGYHSVVSKEEADRIFDCMVWQSCDRPPISSMFEYVEYDSMVYHRAGDLVYVLRRDSLAVDDIRIGDDADVYLRKNILFDGIMVETETRVILEIKVNIEDEMKALGITWSQLRYNNLSDVLARDHPLHRITCAKFDSALKRLGVKNIVYLLRGCGRKPIEYWNLYFYSDEGKTFVNINTNGRYFFKGREIIPLMLENV